MDYKEKKFRTLKGYDLSSKEQITHAMEDYLEMICRYAETDGFARINKLASKLNVKPSSASKMVHNLKALGLVNYEKYGMITPTEKGIELGHYLLYRHEILNRFFCFINSSEDELEQIEQVEHFINEDTVYNIEKLLIKLEALKTKHL